MNYADFYRARSTTATPSGPSRPRLIDWQRPFTQVCDYSHPPFARWFVGGTTNLCHNAVDRHLADARRPARADLGLDRGRPGAHLQLPRAARRGAAHGRDAAGAGRAAGRPRADLHADDPGGGVRDAGLRAHRRDPLGGVRRLRQRQPGHAASTTPSPKVIVSADAGCRGGKVVPYKPLLDEAIRLSAHKPAPVLLVDRGLAPMERDGRPRPRLRDAARSSTATPQVPCAWLDATASELHALHQRHHRQAQGRAARHRRLRGGAGRQHEAHLPAASPARPTSPPATSAGWSATATSSTAR